MSEPRRTRPSGPSHAREQLEAALEWAKLTRVVPCDGKNPGGVLGKSWQHKASRDLEVIRGWWKDKAWNIGIVPGTDLLAVDVDDPDSFERFQQEHGRAPDTPAYWTGRPGRFRLLFRHPGIA